MKSKNLSPSMSNAAAQLGIDVETVREAKRAGSKAFDSGGRVDLTKLRKWLARQPKPAKPTSNGKPDDSGGVMGLSSNLTRLATEERRLSELLTRTIGTAGETAARKAWLLCSEQLRRCDSSLAETRRDSGEFLPRAEVEMVLENFAKLVTQSTRDFTYAVAMAAVSGDAKAAAINALVPARNWILNVAAIATGMSPVALPGWAISAWGKGASNGLDVAEADFLKMNETVRSVLSLSVQNAFAEGSR